jgi:phage terminase large subunit
VRTVARHDRKEAEAEAVTVSRAQKEAKRRAAAPAGPVTMATDLADYVVWKLDYATRLRFPTPAYQTDPVGFCRNILGVEPWSAQIEILEAVRDHPRVAVRSGHKVGKALDPQTPIPTPSGFRPLASLQVGDRVFSEKGEQCTVVSTATWEARPRYRVSFDDGSEIIADAAHEWAVWNARERRQRWRRAAGSSEIVETQDMVGRLDSKGRGRNYSVDVAQPLIGAPVDESAIDPYVLGVWLGDGTTLQGSITNPDPEVWGEIVRRGYKLGLPQSKGNCVNHTVLGLVTVLRKLGLVGHKHVPPWVFGACVEWRREVLRGLVDSDGHVTDRGLVEIVQVKEELARDVFRLVASLGFKPSMKVDDARLNGVVIGPRYRVTYTPHDPFHCYVKRKRDAVKPARTKWQWTRQRMIVAVERIDDGPTKCIEVDSPSHLFLCGDACIPTHNSRTAAVIALWYYCSWPDARVVMSSTTARQVDQILWREVRMVRARGGRCVDCKAAIAELVASGEKLVFAEERYPRPCPHSALIDEEPGELARTGLKSSDFREIVGFTSKEAEAVAGISGENLIYILDEASGIPQMIFDAIEGNRAGGARIVMFSNPTKNEGEFYEAFHGKSTFYHGITVSSEDTPNVVAGKRLIPGLATQEWIDEKREEWGEQSPLYTIRVRGKHATREEGKIFSVHAIGQAEERWSDAPEQGRLFIGLDPSGASGLGDETAIAARRGLKCLEIRVHVGLNTDSILVRLVETLLRLKVPRETPVVVFDAENQLGSELRTKLREYLEKNKAAFEIVPVRASDRAQRQPDVYHRMRDALTANLEAWFRDGGAIPEDSKLVAELHAMEWKQQASGLLKVTPKDILKKLIGRSPDRYDALALACWEPLSLRADVDEKTKASVADAGGDAYDAPATDPYAGAEVWGRSR